MAQDAVAVFARGRARRLHHDAFGKEDRLVGQNERALSLPESHTRRISAPSRNSCQGGAILPLCELGDRAMWIVMYVAMIASLSAMGMLPVAEYRDQLPDDDASSPSIGHYTGWLQASPSIGHYTGWLQTSPSIGHYTGWLQTSPTLGIVLSLLVIIATRTYLGEAAFND